MWYKFAQSQDNIQNIIDLFLSKYPGIELRINEYDNKIKLEKITIPKELRNKGIGTEIISALKIYAEETNKPLVLNPEPEKGKKGALQRFYERNEFVNNTGRNKDYDISDAFSRTMYYKPKRKSTSSNNTFEQNLKSLTSQFVSAAQSIYDEWDEHPDVYFGGGICHLIADAFVSIVDRNFPNYTASTFTRDDIQHVVAIIHDVEPDSLYDEDEEDRIVDTVIIDLYPYTYERGGGFSWTKIPDVEFTDDDITFYKTSTNKNHIGEDY